MRNTARGTSWWIACLLCGLAGCGSDATLADKKDAAAKPTSQDAAEPTPPSAANASASAPATTPEGFLADAGDDWQTLIVGSWEIPAQQETYRCVRFTLPKDLAVGSFRALSPVGTHHTLLTIADSAGMPDGFSTCDASANGTQEIAGSGVGTNDFSMPDGVAVQLKAGQQLILNLHLFNVTDEPIRGTSGTLIKLVADKDIKQRAEGVLAGTISLNLPAGETTTAHGTCTLKDDVTLFAAAPHMHQLGTYLKTVAHSSVSGDVVLHDGPYRFDEQRIYSLDDQVQMKAGDTVDVDCTYLNTTDQTVKFGNSSKAEMCFAGVYWYPATGHQFVCVN